MPPWDILRKRPLCRCSGTVGRLASRIEDARRPPLPVSEPLPAVGETFTGEPPALCPEDRS